MSEKELKVGELTDWCDLMVDEFKRIKARVIEGNFDRIEFICDRAIMNTKQHVPVIDQLDKTIRRAEKAESEAETLREALHKSYEGNVNYRLLRKDIARASGVDMMAMTWDEHIEHIIAMRNRLEALEDKE